MAERYTSKRFDEAYALPAKAATLYERGRLLASNSDGRATAAVAAAGLMVVGIILTTVDNLAGAHGAVQVGYQTGVFLMDNDTAAPLTQAHVNRPCWIKDDITVSADPGEHSVFAGIFRGFHNNGDGAWVDTKLPPIIAHLFSSNPDSNFRFTGDPDSGAPILQLWNQTQEAYQTVQLAGASGLEHLVIAAADA